MGVKQPCNDVCIYHIHAISGIQYLAHRWALYSTPPCTRRPVFFLVIPLSSLCPMSVYKRGTMYNIHIGIWHSSHIARLERKQIRVCRATTSRTPAFGMRCVVSALRDAGIFVQTEVAGMMEGQTRPGDVVGCVDADAGAGRHRHPLADAVECE